MNIIHKEHPSKITLSVSGKFHAISLAREYAKLNLLDGLYCVNRSVKTPPNISKSSYHNRIDLAFWQAAGKFLPFSGFSNQKKNDVFDAWVCEKLRLLSPGILHAWNGCSYKTLKKAKQLGWNTFVERSCPHNQFQHDLLSEEAQNIGVRFSQDLDELKRNIEELYLADGIISPSCYSAGTYKDPELIKKVRRVPLGGNFPYRNRSQKNGMGLKILMVGNSFLRKGTHYLVEAMKSIEDPNAALLIRGDVPDAYRSRIKDPRIKIIPAIPYKKLIDLYLSADVFVQPSIDEGFGMTVLEALSFGLPLVVTDHVGAKDTLNSKVSKVVPIRDANALVVAIYEAKHLPCEEFDIERKAILERFTWKACADGMLKEGYVNQLQMV